MDEKLDRPGWGGIGYNTIRENRMPQTNKFTASLMTTGHFQDHPDGTYATDMIIKHARSLVCTMETPSRPAVIRCSDGVLLVSPPRTGGRDISLKDRGWEVDYMIDGTMCAWRKTAPPRPKAWRWSVKRARDELLKRASNLPPQAVLGVVARHGNGGIDEVGLILSPAAEPEDETRMLAAGDITVGNRTFLVDMFRDSIPPGFGIVSARGGQPSDPSETAAMAGDMDAPSDAPAE